MHTTYPHPSDAECIAIVNKHGGIYSDEAFRLAAKELIAREKYYEQQKQRALHRQDLKDFFLNELDNNLNDCAVYLENRYWNELLNDKSIIKDLLNGNEPTKIEFLKLTISIIN